jgi:aminopeptidase-like protein
MTVRDLHREGAAASETMYSLIQQLYPICRSITGDGVRQTLSILAKTIPLAVHEVATGTRAFDWTVPKEWNIRDAYVKAPDGRRVIDFNESNLHVMGYSVPVRTRMTLAELKPHLHTRPDAPDTIPYRTSYYNEAWGFCLSHRRMLELADVEYDVCIDSSLEDGHLTYGEYLLAGTTPDEVLISCHVCHPSLCNDNLSGIALATTLAALLRGVEGHRYSYRFLFIPGTIGSIAWLARNEPRLGAIRHGLVLANLGDPGAMTYKKSRRGDAEVDRAAAHVLRAAGAPHTIVDFTPYGYDERQFCSPGFDLPVGCFMRSPHGTFPQYHTSDDNLQFVSPRWLADSFEKLVALLALLEENGVYVNLNPKCEPQLGKRGLYRSIGGQSDSATRELAMLWTLNMSDGRHSLLDIAERSGVPFPAIRHATTALQQHALLAEA